MAHLLFLSVIVKEEEVEGEDGTVNLRLLLNLCVPLHEAREEEGRRSRKMTKAVLRLLINLLL